MTRELRAIFLAVVAVLIIAGFVRMAYLTGDIGRMVKAVAAMVYQEAEKTRSTLAPPPR